MTNMIVTTPVNVTGAPVTNTVANHAEKPKKINRQNFKRWQQKMFFYLRTLNLARFLNETVPQVEPPKEGQPFNAQEIGRSSGIDDEFVQDQRQRDDNDLQDERQDQPKEEEVEPKRCKRARTEKLLDPILFLLW
ncbi:hypothetical protein Tco_0611230 [Tanacetum coccineum]